MGFPKCVRDVLVTAFVLAVVLLAGIAPAAAQGRIGSDLLDLGRDDDRSLLVERRAPGGEGGPSLGVFGQRLDLGLVDLGFSVVPRRLLLDTPADSASSAALRYRLGETELPQSDVGLDVRLRWPSWTGALEPRLGPLQPYVSFGPALSRAVGPEPAPFSRATATRSDPGVPVGMRGSVGLTWQLAPDAALFGEYRLTQDRPFAGRHGGDVGADLFYGLSVRF